MKIRTDYVSNSSSSSFMLVGQVFNDEEIEKAWLRLHPDASANVDEDNEDFDIWEICAKLAKELKLDMHRGLENYYDEWAFGLSFDDMKDDETKKDFVKRIEESLKPAFGEVKVETLVDGGTDC